MIKTQIKNPYPHLSSHTTPYTAFYGNENSDRLIVIINKAF